MPNPTLHERKFKNWLSTVLAFLGFLAVAILALYFSADQSDPIFRRAEFWNTSMATLSGPEDYVSYTKYASKLLAGTLDDWIVRNWAPTFPIVIALVTGLTGDAHYFAKMFLVSLFAWGFALTAFFAWVPFIRNRFARWLLIASIWALPDLRNWALGDGTLLSESLSHAVFIGALAYLGRGLVRDDRKDFYKFAVMLGLAGSFRAVLDYSFVFASVIAVLAACGFLVVLYFTVPEVRRRYRTLPALGWGVASNRIARGWFGAVRTLWVVCFLINATMFPWKFYNYARYGSYSFSVGGAGYEWEHHWYPTEKLEYWVKAGNPACVTDPGLCKMLNDSATKPLPEGYRNLSLMTLVAHPWKWVKFRLKNVNWLWLGIPWNNLSNLPMRTAEGAIYLGVGIFGFVILLARIRRARDSLISAFTGDTRSVGLLLLGLLFIFVNASIFLILHFEHRYSLAVRIFCLAFWPLVILPRHSEPNPIAKDARLS